MNRIGSNLISTLSLIQEPCTFSQTPLNFEQIDHGYGYVLYTTTLAHSGSLLLTPNIRDYGYVFLNNIYQVQCSLDIVTPPGGVTISKEHCIAKQKLVFFTDSFRRK